MIMNFNLHSAKIYRTQKTHALNGQFSKLNCKFSIYYYFLEDHYQLYDTLIHHFIALCVFVILYSIKHSYLKNNNSYSIFLHIFLHLLPQLFKYSVPNSNQTNKT